MKNDFENVTKSASKYISLLKGHHFGKLRISIKQASKDSVCYFVPFERKNDFENVTKSASKYIKLLKEHSLELSKGLLWNLKWIR